MKRAQLALATLVIAPATADAFCGFYVSPGDLLGLGLMVPRRRR